MNQPEIPYPIFAAIDAQPAVLTREQEHRLAIRARDGDQRARGELVERNLRLVIKIAHGFTHRAPQLELLDLVSEGVLGLMRAIEKFDPSSGYKLSTYATWWITQAIGRAVDRDGTVTIPGDVRREIRAAERFLSEDARTDPTPGEVHAELSPPMRARVDQHDVASARAGMHCASLDYTRPAARGTTDPLGAFIPDVHSADPCDLVAERLDLQHDIAEATRMLDATERRFVERRFGLGGREPATLMQVATELHIDTATARHLERQAFTKMRATTGDTAPARTPCKPALAVLDLLQTGRRQPLPAKAGQAAIARVAQLA